MAPGDYILNNFVLTCGYVRSYKHEKRNRDKLASAAFTVTQWRFKLCFKSPHIGLHTL